ncbi:MAG: cytochrome c [Chromatiaceae bacterium]|jgi:cytochrome c553|nr:cytochrome c [Chromatiaceae bacterium]
MRSILAAAACGLLVASSAVPAAGDATAGRAKSEPCLGCHGIPSYNNTYPTYHVPKLSGQHADYIVAALKAYRDGQRKHATMNVQAMSMSEQDMADIGAFWQGMEK